MPPSQRFSMNPIPGDTDPIAYIRAVTREKAPTRQRKNARRTSSKNSIGPKDVRGDGSIQITA